MGFKIHSRGDPYAGTGFAVQRYSQVSDGFELWLRCYEAKGSESRQIPIVSSINSDPRRKTFYQKWSGLIVVFAFFMLPLSFYGAGRAIQTNVNRVEDWLPKSFEETRNLTWFREHFASDQFVVISWEGCKLATQVADVATDADPTVVPKDDPRIAKLAELLVPSETASSGGQEGEVAEASPSLDAARRKYFKAVVTGRTLLEQLTRPPLNLPIQEAVSRLQGTMIGPDGQQTCVVVTLHPEALSELKQVIGSGQRRIFRPNVPPGVLRQLVAMADIPADALHLGGPPVDNSAIDEEGEKTLIRLAGFSGLLGLFLAWWALRSVLLTGLVFFCGVMSAAISLSIVWLSGQNVDAILMSMPSLVYVLAISGAVHLLNYYREAIKVTGLHGAAEQAVIHAWKPAVLCSTTTAIGLLSLAASELVPIRKFGMYSAAGVMALVIVVYLFLPAAMQFSKAGTIWLKTGQPSGGHRENRTLWLWEFLATCIVSHYRLVGAACVLITVAAGWGIQHTSSSIDLLKLFDHRARILQDYRWLEANLGKLVPMEIVVRFPVDTQREQAEQQGQPGEAVSLSFLQRLETVGRMQEMIERKFGPLGEDLISRSLSAVSFAPGFPSANSGNYGFIQRKVIDARMRNSKVELSKAGFLRTDVDGSELWRISLRVAAFRNVDYGTFVRELEQITQPLLGAYNARAQILTALAADDAEEDDGGNRVVLWGYTAGPDSKGSQATFQSLLNQLLSESRLQTEMRSDAPDAIQHSEFAGLDKSAAAVVFGDFSDRDLKLVSNRVANVIDAREKSDATRGARKSEDSAAPDQKLSAVFTGVVPIVYQAQRALLNSLVSSTWWSFLTITPIMMLVSRGLLAGCVAMVPNLVPILLIFGGMGWLGISIDVGSMMTASIALGVAVDDTIHFLARYRYELSRASDKRQAIVATYSHCALPTLQAALISGFGLSVFALSTFTPTQRFGWLMLCILLAGVVSELVLLPALLASPLGRVFGIRTPRPATQ